MPNVFQNLKDSMPPLIPAPMDNELGDPMGKTNELGDPLPEDSEIQKVSTDKAKPKVFASPQEEMGEHLGSKLDQDYQKDLHPWGTPENHPGVFGKIGHALSVATGGVNRRGWEEQGIEKRLNDLAAENSKNAYQGAETAHTQAETNEVAPNAASQRAYQGSETEKNLHPADAKDAWSVDEHHEGPNGEPVEVNKTTGELRVAGQSVPGIKRVMADAKPDPARQQLVDEFQKAHPGATLAKANEYASQALQAPQRAPIVNMFVPGANGESTLQQVHAGQSVGPGAQTAAGLNSVNTPTTQQRTAAGRAETVVAMAPQVIQEIAQQADQLGPLMGRWGDFMQGKVGMDNPSFAGLRTDLMMLSTAVALAHAQGRLPENLRMEFDHAINAPQQTPENLKAVISHVLPWMQKMQEQGHPNGGGAQGGSPQRPTNVPEGYVFKDGPKGKGWYRP